MSVKPPREALVAKWAGVEIYRNLFMYGHFRWMAGHTTLEPEERELGQKIIKACDDAIELTKRTRWQLDQELKKRRLPVQALTYTKWGQVTRILLYDYGQDIVRSVDTVLTVRTTKKYIPRPRYPR